MAEEQCSIYYSYGDISDLDTICNFLQKKRVSINDSQTKIFFALDCNGNEYETDYEQIKQNIVNNKIVNLKIWLRPLDDIIWTIRINGNFWIYDFSLYYLGDQEINEFSKKIFELFIESFSTRHPAIGMFIDKYGATYDYNFDPFFFTNSEDIDYVTDLICTPKEKLKLIKLEPDFGVRELDNSFVCVSRYPEFLDYLLSND